MVRSALLLGLLHTTRAMSDLRRAAPQPDARTFAEISKSTEIPEIYSDSNPYNLAPREGVDPKFDCAWRRAAYAYGKKLQPQMTAAHQAQLSDALELGRCPGGAPEPSDDAPTEKSRRTFEISNDSTAIFVDPATTDGLHKALAKARGITGHTTLALLPGVHRITKPLLLSPADSNTTIQSHMGGEAVLTGTKLLPPLKWEKFNVDPGSKVWKTVPGYNAVYAATPDNVTVKIYGLTDTASACQAACAASVGFKCNVYT